MPLTHSQFTNLPKSLGTFAAIAGVVRSGLFILDLAARDVDHDLANWARSRGVGVFHGRNRECVNSPGFKLNASITLAGSG